MLCGCVALRCNECQTVLSLIEAAFGLCSAGCCVGLQLVYVGAQAAIDAMLTGERAAELEEARKRQEKRGAVIFVKTLTGQLLVFPYDAYMYLERLKRLVQGKCGIPVDQQRMICGGRQVWLV